MMEKKGLRIGLVILFWAAVLGVGAYFVRDWMVTKPAKKVEAEKQKQEAEKQQLVIDTSTDIRYQTEVRMLADSFSGYCILRSPEMGSLLKKDDIKLTVIDDKADYLARMTALKEGKADMAVFTVDSFLTSGIKLGEFPAAIVAVIDETKGADAAIAYKSAVPSIQDLNKKNAGFVLTPNSPSEFLARIIMADFSLPDLPVNCINSANGSEDVLSKFKKASRTEPKVYIMWEPDVSKALADPEAIAILASDRLKGYIEDVYVARRQFLKEKPEIVKKVLEAHLRSAYKYSESGLAELVKEDALSYGQQLSDAEACQVIKGIQWKNTLENYAHLGLLSAQETRGLDDMGTIISKIAKVLIVTGAISKDSMKVPINTLYFDGVLGQMRSENFHPAQKAGVLTTTQEMQPIRGDQELPALDEQEWQKLVPVGQMRVQSLSFRRGTADLSFDSQQDLEELVAKLQSMPRYYLVITGHARADGDMDANIRLAKERADSVSDSLIKGFRISPNRIKVMAAKPSGGTGTDQSVTFQVGQRPY